MLAIGIGTTIELITRLIGDPGYRAMLVVMTIALGILIWADNAVGVF